MSTNAAETPGYKDYTNAFDIRFGKLTETERHCLFLLAVSGYGISLNSASVMFHQLLSRLGPVSRQTDSFLRFPTTVNIQMTIRSLIEKGWNISSGQLMFQYEGAERESLVRYLVQKNEYQKYYEASQAIVYSSYGKRICYTKQKYELIRDLFAKACPSGKVSRQEVIDILPTSWWDEIAQSLFFCRNLPWVEFMEDDLFGEMAYIWLYKIIVGLKTIPEYILDYLLFMLKKGRLSSDVILLLYEYFWLRNHSLASSTVFPESLQKAYTALWTGDYSQALQEFDSLPEKWFYCNGNKKRITLPGLSGVFYSLCLFYLKQTEKMKKVCDWIHNSIRTDAIPEPPMEVWRMMTGVADSCQPGAEPPTFRVTESNWVNLVFLGLVKHWCPKCSAYSPAIGFTYTEMSLLSSYPRVIFLLNDIKNNIRQSVPFPPIPDIQELHNRYIPLSMGRKPPEPWEDALKQLNYMFDVYEKQNSSETNGEQEERLAWILEYSPDQLVLTVTPRIQVRSKRTGNWSKGRAIDWRQLPGDLEQIPWLNQEDRTILYAADQTLLSMRVLSSSNYHLAPLFGEDIFPALIGHPNLFLENRPNTPIELVLEKPSVTIEKKEGGVLVSPTFVTLLPEAIKEQAGNKVFYHIITKTEQHILALPDGEDKFRIFPLKESKKIFQVLGVYGKFFPESAIPQLEQVLAKMPRQLRLQSNVKMALGEVKDVQCDSQLYLKLLPLEQDGFILEMLVFPLGQSGMGLVPGSGAPTLVAEVLGRMLQTVRDIPHEKELVEKVLAACPSLQNTAIDGGQRYSLDSLELALQFLSEFQTARLAEVELLQPKGVRYQVTSIASYENLQLSMKKAKDWLEVSGTFEVDEKSFDFRKLLDMVNLDSSNRFVKLGEKEYLVLTEELRRRLANLKRLTQKGKKVIVNPLAAVTLDDFFDNVPSLRKSESWLNVKEGLNKAQDFEPVFPPTFAGRLRDYQMEGFQWMARMANWGVGVCLADDMGLGKTVQGLAILLSRIKLGPALIVAPTSVVGNWEREAKRFAPDLNVSKIQAIGSGGGTRTDRLTTIENAKSGDLLITSYGLMQQEIDSLSQHHFATIILDESQAIKNPDTNRAVAAGKLQGDFRIAMSGTPIENRLTELWSLFHYLNPGLLPERRAFDERFTIPIQKYGSKESRTTLRRLVQPFILRRTKGEVLEELPARTEISLEVELSPEERVYYEQVREECLKALERSQKSSPKASNDPSAKRFEILAALTRLRQICCNTKMLNGDSKISSAKMETFLNVANDLLENRHKTLVFSQFVKHLQLVAKELDARKISYQYLDGATSMVQRQKAIDAFQAGEGDFFLISLKAGGVGLNLTAADYVIHLDPWWNPAVEDQATDRAHRIGQTKPVTVYRLITTGTIEEKIVQLHHEKRDLAKKILDGTDQTASLSGEELLNILRE